MRIFKTSRFLVSMVYAVVLRIKSFFVMMFYFIFIFECIWRMLPSIASGFTSDDLSVADSLKSTFSIAFMSYSTDDYQLKEWIVFVIAILTLNFILLNYLVSIICIFYEEVATSTLITDIDEVIKMINEADCLYSGFPETKSVLAALGCDRKKKAAETGRSEIQSKPGKDSTKQKPGQNSKKPQVLPRVLSAKSKVEETAGDTGIEVTDDFDDIDFRNHVEHIERFLHQMAVGNSQDFSQDYIDTRETKRRSRAEGRKRKCCSFLTNAEVEAEEFLHSKHYISLVPAVQGEDNENEPDVESKPAIKANIVSTVDMSPNRKHAAEVAHATTGLAYPEIIGHNVPDRNSGTEKFNEEALYAYIDSQHRKLKSDLDMKFASFAQQIFERLDKVLEEHRENKMTLMPASTGGFRDDTSRFVVHTPRPMQVFTPGQQTSTHEDVPESTSIPQEFPELN